VEGLVNAVISSEFWSGKRVFVTGHTGFKGSWLLAWLQKLGAQIQMLALAPDTIPNLYSQLNPADDQGHFIGDIRDAALVRERIQLAKPDIVLHLAAQPLVLRGYEEPLETWQTNVMGTAHVLDALKGIDRKIAVVIVTTDKVYENREWAHAYRETDRLGGHDPYSASKAACELLVKSYQKSFLGNSDIHIGTARAGNVIGGGDWADNRITPDLVRALEKGETLNVRNPNAVRPWQHVLDPLAGYLLMAQALWEGKLQSGEALNFGPEAVDQRSVKELIEEALKSWPGDWADTSNPDAVHEAGRLMLSIDKTREQLNWAPRWDFSQAVAQTIDWYRQVSQGANPKDLTLKQIAAFEAPAE
jgi:CDP-glucose 4,6-dehydratase